MDFPAILKSSTDEQLRAAVDTLQHKLNQSINQRQHGTALCFARPLVDVLNEIEDRRTHRPHHART